MLELGGRNMKVTSRQTWPRRMAALLKMRYELRFTGISMSRTKTAAMDTTTYIIRLLMA